MVTTTNEYLLLLIERGKSLKPLKEKLYSMGGFYDGIGYAFPCASELMLSQIVKPLGLKIIKRALGEGQTFEKLKQAHKVMFFRDTLIKVEQRLLVYREELELDDLTKETIKDSIASEQKKEVIIELLCESERLRESIDWAGRMEKSQAISVGKSLDLRFISEISKDYFLKTPPVKPSLLVYEKNDGNMEATKIPFLHKEVTAMLVAEGGRGKTHLCAHLATCVTSGVPFLGKFEIASPGAVCMIVGENNPEDIKRLLFKSRNHIKKMLDENEKNRGVKDYKRFPTDGKELSRIEKLLCPVSVHGLQANLVDGKGNPTNFFHILLEELKTKEPEEGFQLIIIDPASRFAGAESEKDNAVATAFISRLEQISASLKGKPTILLSHHKSKAGTRDSAGQTDARGASALVDGARWMATLTSNNTEDDFSLFLAVPKTNFTPPVKKILIKKTWDGLMSFERFE